MDITTSHKFWYISMLCQICNLDQGILLVYHILNKCNIMHPNDPLLRTQYPMYLKQNQIKKKSCDQFDMEIIMKYTYINIKRAYG